MKTAICGVAAILCLASVCFFSSKDLLKVNSKDAKESFLLKMLTNTIKRNASYHEKLLHQPGKKFRLAIVGLGRTGSTSLHISLKILGYTSVHDEEALVLFDLFDHMMKDSMNMNDIMDQFEKRGFDAAHIPIHKFVKWAANAPNVKVILTIREKKTWAASYASLSPLAHLLYQRPFTWIKPLRERFRAFITEVYINVPTNGQKEGFQDLKTLEMGYDAWVDFVRKTIPKNRLLEFNVKDGWKPLCEFLGTPIPNVSFPNVFISRTVIGNIIQVANFIAWFWPIIFMSSILFYCLFFRYVFCCLSSQYKRLDFKKNKLL